MKAVQTERLIRVHVSFFQVSGLSARGSTRAFPSARLNSAEFHVDIGRALAAAAQGMLLDALRRDRTGDLLITIFRVWRDNIERSEYIEQRNGGFYVAGRRVSLDSIVYSVNAGDSPQTIRQNFSSLSLEQVYGAIAFYLAHEQQIDENIREGEGKLSGRSRP
jgi:uncharacterized protein (DUF433 family)